MREDAHKQESKSTILTCRAPNANFVYVAGSFNDWSESSIPLTKGKDGEWSVTLNLTPGQYEYKFLVDGVWCCEPGCPDEPYRGCDNCTLNPFGTMNRVVAIG